MPISNESEKRDSHGRWTATGAVIASQKANVATRKSKKENSKQSHEDAIKAHLIAKEAQEAMGNSVTAEYHAKMIRSHNELLTTASPHTSAPAPAPASAPVSKIAPQSSKGSNGIPANVTFTGSPKAKAEVQEAMKKIPSGAFKDSTLRFVVASDHSIANPTGVMGDVVGHMDHGTMRLYPGFDQAVVHHEFGHSLQAAHLKAYMQTVGNEKNRGGYGNRESAIKESFANSFQNYVKYGKDPFWSKIYG